MLLYLRIIAAIMERKIFSSINLIILIRFLSFHRITNQSEYFLSNSIYNFIASLFYLNHVSFLYYIDEDWCWYGRFTWNKWNAFILKTKPKRNWQVMSKISQAWCQKFLIMSTTLRMKKQKPLLQNLIYFYSIYHLCKLTV